MITVAGLERDVLIVACAISSGIHAVLAPRHFGEGLGAGLGFGAAAVLLAGLVLVLTYRPESTVAVAATGAVLAGLIVSYVLAVATGIPLVHAEPEPVAGLALATKAVEAAGLLGSLHLLWRGRPVVADLRTKGMPA